MKNLGVDLKLHIAALKLVGLWKLSGASPLLHFLYEFFAWFNIILVGFNAVSDLTYLFINDIDLPTISDAVTTIGSFVKGFLLSMKFILMKERVCRLVEKMEQIKSSRENATESETNILRQADREAKIITAYVFVPHFILVAFMNAVPLMLNRHVDNYTNSTEPLHLQYKGWFPFDVTHGANYRIALLSQSVGMWIVYVYVSVFETISVAIMIQISAEFDIAYNNFQSLIEPKDGQHLEIKSHNGEGNNGLQNLAQRTNSQIADLDNERKLTQVSVNKAETSKIPNFSHDQNNTVHPFSSSLDVESENIPEARGGKDSVKMTEKEYDERVTRCISHHQIILK